MHLTLQSPWLLLLIFPTLAMVIGLCRRARFSVRRSGLYALIATGLVLCLAGPARLPFRDRIATVYLIDHSDSVADFRGELNTIQPLFAGDNRAALEAWTQPQPWWLFGNNLVVNADTDMATTGVGAENQLQGLVDRSGSRYGVALDVLRRWAQDKPPGCAVLIGDGNAQDLPAALAQATALRRMGWTLDTLAAPAPALDFAVVGLDCPPTVAPDRYVSVRVQLHANAPGIGAVRLVVRDRDDKTTFEDNRALTFAAAGEQAVQFGFRLDKPGAYRIVAQVNAAGPAAAAASAASAVVSDALPANDFGYQMITVQADEISILHVVDDARPSALSIQLQHMAESLPERHWQYTAMTPKRFAALGGVPRKTRLLILDNIAREDLNLVTWRAINTFVQVEGGGLLALGGEQAFGAGGHRPDEDFERCLPIKMEPPKNRRIDVVLIVDTSASMADTIVESAVKTSKLDAAKEAVWGLLGGQSLLGDDDRIALLTFSDEARLRLPFTPIREALTIKQQLATLQPEGATRPAPAVEQALHLTAASPADKIFYVFVSDGQPSTSGPEQVDFASGQNNRIIELLQKNIDADGKRSFWPIFIGDAQGTDPYRKTLSDFARYGHGRMIWPQSAGNSHPAPGEATTLLEALRAILDEGNRDRFVGKKTFQLADTGSTHPLAPPLATAGAYPWRNRVGEKPDADRLWSAREADAAIVPPGAAAHPPEVAAAAGRYGNGRSAAIAMPLNTLMIQGRKSNPRLANQWIDWVAWLTGGGEKENAWVELRAADAELAAALNIAPGAACLCVDLFDPAGRAVTRLDYDLRPVPLEADSLPGGIAPPAAATATPPLRWIAPGRFAAPWLRRDPQAALFAVQLDAIAADGAVRPLGRLRLAVPAGPEYLQTDLQPAALTALATAGGGKLLEPATAAQEWRWRVENQWRAGRSARIAQDGDDLRPWLAAVLALLVIADTAIRWLKPATVASAPASAPLGEPPPV